MSIALANAPFKATGATTARTLGAHFGDVINVKDFGAIGSGLVDDAPAIQAAFNAAFGSSGSPHGATNKHLNKPVFFPNGIYQLSSNLDLTKVVGGRIYGAGVESTIISRDSGTNLIALDINGAAFLTIEMMTISAQGTGSCAINLDWDGDDTGNGCEGLHSNHFSDLLLSGASGGTQGGYGVIIADTDNEGCDNLFSGVTVTQFAVAGIEARGTGAINNQTNGGGASSCAAGYKCTGGSIHVHCPSLAGNTYDVVVSANWPVSITGGRTESDLLNMSTGIVTIKGATQFNDPDAGPTTKFANITGGICIIDGCHSNCGVITGSGGNLYLRGNNWTDAAWDTALAAWDSAGGTIVLDQDP
jgi:hypothetical protein